MQENSVNGLDEEDVNLLQSIAGQVAISLQNARILEETRTKSELESLVNIIGSRIQRAATVEETLQTAIRELGTAIAASPVKAGAESSNRNRMGCIQRERLPKCTWNSYRDYSK